MSTGGSHLQGTFNALLTADVSKVQFVQVLLCVELLASVYHGGLITSVAVEETDDVHQRVHAVNLYVVYYGGFPDILVGDYQCLVMRGSGSDGSGECPPAGLQSTVQSQFSH